MDNWYLYIARCSDGTLYTGVSNDVAGRIKKHNEKRGAAYTRSRLPITLEHQELVGSYGDALKREAQVKKLSRREKEDLIGASLKHKHSATLM
jgi:putative endonuclease